MIKTIQTPLAESELQAFIKSSSKEKAAIIQGFFLALEESELSHLLVGFCNGDLESYNEDPAVSHISMDDEMTGTIDLEFTGSARNGCRDMERLDEHNEVVTFEVSAEMLNVTFTTEPPDPAERPPDEEF